MPVKQEHKIILLSLFFTVLEAVWGILVSQTPVNGVINKYARITGIGANYVTVFNIAQLSQFNPGDTVMLIQMKGLRIYGKEEFSYGYSGFSYGKPGKFEFLRIKSIDASANKIVFRQDILNKDFNLKGDIQLIKVPYYDFASVVNTLTCVPWDSSAKTGGVLALVVGRRLSIKADMNVTGKGFTGGAISLGLGVCISTNYDKLNKYAFPGTTDSAGFKGEGLSVEADPDINNLPPFIPVNPSFLKGYGRNFNGGGGGNGRFSGGGGGGNYGLGGRGGTEASLCMPNFSGGLGGFSVSGIPLNGDIVPGGGGGASTWMPGGNPTPGANGGGIVMIVCDTLEGNGMKIISDGASPSSAASGFAGAGGGGAGGSVAITLRSFSDIPLKSALTISANGGKGGDNTGTFGEGGGGGGGLITTNNVLPPANIIKSVAGGIEGTRNGTSTATAGIEGSILTSFNLVFNGFLFNSIYSLKNNKCDTISSGEIPHPITGTMPAGGSGTYSYKWIKSYYSSGPWSEITGAASGNFMPSAPETNTLWIRRVVKDETTMVSDTSMAIKVFVSIPNSDERITSDNRILIYPNPARDYAELLIHNKRNGNVEIDIINLSGIKIASWISQKDQEEFRFSIPLSSLPEGAYFVRVMTGRKIYAAVKLVIQK